MAYEYPRINQDNHNRKEVDMTLGKRAQVNPNTKTLLSFKKVTQKFDQMVQDNQGVWHIPLEFTDGELDPPKNKTFYSYEQDLLKLLIELDAIECEGSLRESRKRIVQRVQGELHKLDAFKKEQLLNPIKVPGKWYTYWVYLIVFLGLVFGLAFYYKV